MGGGEKGTNGGKGRENQKRGVDRKRQKGVRTEKTPGATGGKTTAGGFGAKNWPRAKLIKKKCYKKNPPMGGARGNKQGWFVLKQKNKN